MAHLFRIWLWGWRVMRRGRGQASDKSCEDGPAFAGEAPGQAGVIGHVEEAGHGG